MLDGAMEHRDSLGNHGHLGPGSAQWMTAGHGIVHSEMPQQEKGRMWGFQLWVNLPAANKMIRPRYQDIAPGRVLEAMVDDAAVRLVAGEVDGRRGPVEGIVTAPEMLDVSLPAKGRDVARAPRDAQRVRLRHRRERADRRRADDGRARGSSPCSAPAISSRCARTAAAGCSASPVARSASRSRATGRS